MNLTSYDRLFPSQDVLPAGGIGNLIAAPLQGRARHGATVFLDLATLEPHADQWSYLSALGRSPRGGGAAADRSGKITVAGEVTRLATPSSTRPGPSPAGGQRPARCWHRSTGGADPGAARDAAARGVDAEPGVLRPAADRFSTWGVPRFLHCFDETLDGRLVLPRGLTGLLASTVQEAGSSLEFDDRRADGTPQQFALTATLRDDQADAIADLADHDHGVLVAAPGAGKTVIACALIIAGTRPRHWCWSTARPSPISGGRGWRNTSASPRASSVAAAQSYAARSTW